MNKKIIITTLITFLTALEARGFSDGPVYCFDNNEPVNQSCSFQKNLMIHYVQ